MVKYPVGSVDVLLNKNSILDADLQFQGLEIQYPYHEIPRVKVNLFGFKYNKVVTESELDLKLTLKGGDNYSFPFYVKEIAQLKDTTELLGFACKLEFMKTSNTKYLGSDLKSAIGSCCGHLSTKNLNIPNIKGEFYQINETDYQALLRLMKGSSSDDNWAITESELLLINKNKVSEISVDEVPKIAHNVVTKDKSKPIVDNSLSNDFYTQGWYRNMYVESSSEDYLRNVLSSSSKFQSYENLIPVIYNKNEMISTPVGTEVKMKSGVYRIEKFDLISKTVKVSQQKVETELLLGANNG